LNETLEDPKEGSELAKGTLSVPAVQRTLAILDYLSQSHRGATISQVSRALNLPKSTSHALLITMERCGYVHRDPANRRYRVGMRLFRLANMAIGRTGLSEHASGVLRQLAEQTHMASHMAILEDGDLDRKASRRALHGARESSAGTYRRSGV
jgi:DNA-binding IclR family transcriptional regulator